MILPLLSSLLVPPLTEDFLTLTTPYPGDGPVQRVELARIDDNDLLDLVVLRGDEVWVGFDFAAQVQYVLAASGVSDLAILPPQAGQSTSRLLTASETTLEQLHWSWTTASFSLEHAFAVSILSSIEEVQYVEWNAGNGWLVLGNDRHVVVGSHGLGDAANVDFAFTTPTAVDAIAPLEWDGDAVDEAVLISNGRIQVCDAFGQLQNDLGAAHPLDRVVVLRDYSAGKDAIAWLTRAYDSQNVGLVTWALGAPEPVQWLGDIEVADARLADVVGSGSAHNDLLISRADAEEILVLEGAPIGPSRVNTFDLGGGGFALDTPTTEPCPASGCPEEEGSLARALGAGDLDGDGDTDVVCAVDSRGEFLEIRSGATEFFARRIEVELDGHLLNAAGANAGPINPAPLSMTLQLGGDILGATKAQVAIMGVNEGTSGLLLSETWSLTGSITEVLVSLDTGAFSSSSPFLMHLTPLDANGNPLAEPTSVRLDCTGDGLYASHLLPNLTAFIPLDIHPETLGGATDRPKLNPAPPANPMPPAPPSGP